MLAALLTRGGSVAQVATFAWLFMIHRDVARNRRESERRLRDIELYLWPARHRCTPDIDP